MSTLEVKELSHPTGEVLKIATGKTLDLKSQGTTTLPTGSVLQVVTMNTLTTYTGSSVSWANTNSLLAITPTSASSKIVGYVTGFGLKGSQNQYEIQYRIAKDGTSLAPESGGGSVWSFGSSGNNELYAPLTFHFNDSPSTTSEITYSLQIRSTNASTTGNWYRKQSVTLMEIQG